MEPTRPFRDRAAAGRALAIALGAYRGRPDALVLALPRGGVPVAFEVADALGIELDLVLVRKLGAPGHEELAMGAVAFGGQAFVDRWIVDRLQVSPAVVAATIERERAELRRRERAYRGERPPVVVRDRIVICVDDGLATGASMRAAVAALREEAPARIVVAVPIAAAEIARELQEIADEVIVACTPKDFRAVSMWYDDFTQTGDDEVRALLARARRP